MDEYWNFAVQWPARWLPGLRYLVGVSGGVDSVVLLRSLVKVGFWDVVVCHLNHGLRGRAGDGDAEFVRELSGELRLPFDGGERDVAALARERGQSLETAGRAARHEFFAEAAERHRCRRVVLAHHADDQAETVLMNLCRGSAGPAGMAEETPLPVPDDKPLLLIRPLLPVSKSLLKAVAKEHAWKFREDASNSSTDFVRNRVRNEVLPLLEDIFRRNVRPPILRAADWAEGARVFLKKSASGWTDRAQLPVKEIRELPPALQREVMAGWLRARGVPDISTALISTALSMLDSETGPARWNLPGNLFLRRRAGLMWVESVPACGTGPD